MKIILIDVMSLDGKITKWDGTDAAEWASPEDGALFRQAIAESDVLIMGGATYRAIRPAAQKERLRLVLTRSPDAYMQDAVAGQLEFTSEAPQEAVARLAAAGYQRALLVCGSDLATTFIKENLVDELWVTIEPKLFGQGLPLVLPEQLDIQLRLQEFSRLNPTGAVLLKYTFLAK